MNKYFRMKNMILIHSHITFWEFRDDVVAWERLG